MSIVGVILAAGAGRRIGGPKALLSIGGESFLARVAHLLARPGVDRVAAVLGHDRERVRREAGIPDGVAILDNPDYESGMLGSILRGVEYANAQGAQAVLIHPVDHPLVAPATIDRVVAALQGGATIAVPSWQDRRGHPAGFSREAWPALRTAPPDIGARDVLMRHPEWVVHVAGDPGCREGVNTPEDYARLVGPA